MEYSDADKIAAAILTAAYATGNVASHDVLKSHYSIRAGVGFIDSTPGKET